MPFKISNLYKLIVFIFFGTFFTLLKKMISLLGVIPIVMNIVGYKTNSNLFRLLAVKLLIIGISLAILLTINHFFLKFQLI